MGLFVCDECSVVENTALSRYAFRYMEGHGKALCSLCDPEIARWHGVFPRREYDPANDEVKNRKPADA